MRKILVIGANTRPVACSAKKLGHTVYCADYFCTSDLRACSTNLKCVLSQKPYESCGRFKDQFNTLLLQDSARNFVEEADFILCCSGIMPEMFLESKIIGNKKTEHVENKFKFYKKIKNKFNTPKTYKISDINEVSEIAANNPDKNFIMKPIFSSGGIGIKKFENTGDEFHFSEIILQERIQGHDISASVLSTGKEVETIFTSKQILGSAELGQMEPFGYCGNLAPYLDDPGIKEIAEDVVTHFRLKGSNGVDMVYDGEDIHIIEVNPRFQGTFECGELLLGINMVDAHIKACEGILIETKPPKGFAVKMIVFARERSIVGDLNFIGVHDIPDENVIIEKGEPVATVIKTGETVEHAIYSARNTVLSVYKSIRYY